MSLTHVQPQKRHVKINKHPEDNNNTNSKLTQQQQARTFTSWFKRMIDHERQSFPLYLADDISLEWFGRTIKTRKKVSAFIKYDMQCSRHDFTSIENIDKIENRHDILGRKQNNFSISPQHSPELIKTSRPGKRRLLRSNCHSPEWAEGCGPKEDDIIDTKRLKTENIDHENVCHNNENGLKRRLTEKESQEISYDGDGVSQKIKRKCMSITPPNKEIGQGDCYPSTSGADSDKSHDALNAQLPKLAVECNGYIEFTRTRNNRSVDAMKWERKCKVQISYSEDPLNIGEYIIWALRYTDESKCRRNLLSAFEEAARNDRLNNVS